MSDIMQAEMKKQTQKWPMVKLGDLVIAHYGKALKKENRNESGKFDVYGSSGLVGKHDGALTDESTLIVGRKGSVGEIVWAENGGWVIDTAYYLQVLQPEKLDLRYLFYALKKADLRSRTITTSIPGLNRDDFYGTEIPLPPLEEQKRIAAILDKADAIRRKRQQAIKLADEFLRSVFLDMFGDPVTNPKGWKVVDSGELYLAPPRIGTTTPAKGEGSLVVRVGELGQFNIAFERCGRVQLSEADFDKFVLVPGDTVLARAIGSKNQLGKASYYSGYTESVVIDSHVMRLRPNKEICNPEWFYRFVSSDGGKSLLQKAGGATAVQFNINAKQASKLKIPLPPLALQNKFIELCSSYLKSSNNSLAQESMAFDLFNSLSQKAFSGQL